VTNDALLLAIHLIPGLRWNEKLALWENTQDDSVFRALSAADVERVAERPLWHDWKPSEILAQAEAMMKGILARKIRLLGYHDPAYPPQLREIYDPPFLLFCRGEIPAWDFTALAIVGTRYPSGRARRAAWELAAQAARQGVSVVSGLARGIDGEAHRGCLEAGGHTIAVLGNGADTVFPSSHKALASRILDSGGLVMTEYAPGAGVRKYFFPARNRIISGLSRAVVVAEAPAKSGALITAGYALQQGRDLYVHAEGLPGGEGGRRLAEDGALPVNCIDDIIRDWGEEPAAAPEMTLGIPQKRSPGKNMALFLEEELAGNLARHQGNYFRRNQDG
jgi:DNA processing protein